MTEAALAAVVARHFAARGYEMHGEVVSCRAGRFDLVALTDSDVVLIETKMGYTGELREQLKARIGHADFLYAAVPERKRPLPVEPIEWGVLTVGAAVTEIRPAPRCVDPKWASVTRKRCTRHTLGKPGGVMMGEKGCATPWREIVWDCHRALEPLGRFTYGQARDVCGPILTGWGYGPDTIKSVLSRSQCFDAFEPYKEPGDSRALLRWECNGIGVPGAATHLDRTQ